MRTKARSAPRSRRDSSPARRDAGRDLDPSCSSGRPAPFPDDGSTGCPALRRLGQLQTHRARRTCEEIIGPPGCDDRARAMRSPGPRREDLTRARPRSSSPPAGGGSADLFFLVPSPAPRVPACSGRAFASEPVAHHRDRRIRCIRCPLLATPSAEDGLRDDGDGHFHAHRVGDAPVTSPVSSTYDETGSNPRSSRYAAPIRSNRSHDRMTEPFRSTEGSLEVEPVLVVREHA